MSKPDSNVQDRPDKATQKIAPSKGANDTAMILRQKYTRRREAIQRFTERLQKGGIPDEAELNTLRNVGVSEQEIKGLVAQHAGR